MKKIMALILSLVLTVAQTGIIGVATENFYVVSIIANKNSSGKISNIDSENPFIDIVFSDDVNPATVSSDTIIIKNVQSGEVLEYDIYSVSDSTVKIYLGELPGARTDRTADMVEYEITVTESVLSLDEEAVTMKTEKISVGGIINVLYVAGKILTNVAEDKGVYTAKGVYNGDQVGNYPLKNLTSSLTTGSTNLPQSGTSRKGVIDLENYYNVCGVGIKWLGGVGTEANANNIATNISVSAPWISGITTETFVTGREIYPATSDDKGPNGATFYLTSDSGDMRRTRYISLEKPGSGSAYLTRFYAYAYVDADFKGWNAEKDNESVEKISESGTYGIKLSVNVLKPSGKYYVLAASYDGSGRIIEKDVSEIYTDSVGDKSYTHSFSVDENTASIKAICIDSLYRGKNLIPPFELKRDGVKAEISAESNISHTETEEKTTFLGKASGYTYDEQVNIIMTALSVSEYNESVSTADILSFDSTIIKNNDFSLTAYNEGAGKYKLQFTRETAEGNAGFEDYGITFITSEIIDEMIENFEDVLSVEELRDVFKRYVIQEEILSLEKIPELIGGIDDITAKYYVWLLKNEKYKDLNTVEDIIRLMQASYVLASIETKLPAEAYAAAVEYSSALSEDIIEKSCLKSAADVEKLQNIFSNIKSDMTDDKSMLSVFRWSAFLSRFSGASPKTLAEAVEAYKEITDPNGQLEAYRKSKISTATGEQLSLVEITKLFDTKSPLEYYGTEKFSEKYKSCADSAAYAGSSTGSVVSGSSYGGGGGGGVKVAVSAESVNKEEIDEKKEESAEKDENKENLDEGLNTDSEQIKKSDRIEFSDLEKYDWAYEAIAVLKSQNIVNGTKEYTYEPERNVTREEFVKMCVLAMTLDLKSGKYVTFRDLSEEEWFVPYIQIAVSNGVTGGISSEEFGAGRDITREDAAVMLSRAMTAKGFKFLNRSELDFDDNADISDYAKSEISKIYGEKIINGYADGTFRAKNEITRAEAAVMIYRAYLTTGGKVK